MGKDLEHPPIKNLDLPHKPSSLSLHVIVNNAFNMVY